MQRVKLKLTDAKGALCAVHRLIATQQGHMAGVKLRVLRRPQGGVPQIDTAGDIGIFPGEQRDGAAAFVHGLPLPVLYHDLHGERFILSGLVADLHLQPDGADGLFHLGCVNAQSLRRDMRLPTSMQPHRAIQPGAAVPAGVGLLVIAHGDLQTVFFAGAQRRFQRHKKAPIPAVVFDQQRVVQPHLGIPHCSLYLQHP